MRDGAALDQPMRRDVAPSLSMVSIECEESKCQSGCVNGNVKLATVDGGAKPPETEIERARSKDGALASLQFGRE